MKIFKYLYLLILVFSIFSNQNLYGQPIKEGYLYKKGILKRKANITTDKGGGATKLTLEELDIIYVYEDAGGYCKVGTNAKRAIGFLSKKDIQEWNSRICLHFTSMAGRKPALVFNSAENLEKCIKGSTSFYIDDDTPNSNALAQEPEEGGAIDRFSMLLPVIDRKRTSGRGGPNTMYEVGFLAGNGESAIAATKPIPTASSATTAQLELMFLVDATASMEPFIRATKDIIIEVTNRMSRRREAGIKIGITAFRDYIDEQEKMGFVTHQFSDLTSYTKSVIKILEDHVKAAAADSEDHPEAVFDGFFASVTETSWKESPNTLRVIILIGDASGHDPSHPKNPTKISLEDCINKANEKRVRTIAVKINSGKNEDDKKSKSQFYAIAEGSTLADKGEFLVAEYPDDELNDSEITKFINATSSQIETEIRRLEKMIEIVEERKTDMFAVKGLTATDRAIILKNIHIPKSGSDPFVFSTGWINEHNEKGTKLVNGFAYLTRDEFDQVQGFLRLVDQYIVNPEKTVGETFNKVIEMLTGEPLEGRDLEAHYKKTLGLPIKTELLRIPSEEISSWGADRMAKMAQLVKNKINSIQKFGNSLDNWKKIPGTKGETYTFIPLELLP